MRKDAPELTCPSAPCAPGATLLGTMGRDGVLSYLRTPMQIDGDFVAVARNHGPPEARMRFASPCQEGNCAQWTGDGCGVVRKVLAAIEAQGGLPQDDLQPCVIRASCRWYSERSGAACTACKYVVTDQYAVVAAE
ncbi:hypothetical protein [Marimonas arenosa]|uniref:Nitrogen fixation protein n=1 Tax=Marimonas arenosa TaxID=1795305 RepID=A0AAE3WGR0_9RHOB|nr:hypothetical protein [Marimonas arenosa]MDQ2092382.1 hypothetical protein [Marimonas arenosa]